MKLAIAACLLAVVSAGHDNPDGLLDRLLHWFLDWFGLMEPATTAPTTAAPTMLPFDGHVLCYGDSLTAGVTGSVTDPRVPYAPFLEEELTGTKPTTFKLIGNVVDYVGLPGFSAKQMLENKDHPRWGLTPAIEQAFQPIDVVVILVGTNDLFQTPDASSILADAIALHELALNSTKVAYTITIDIPGSKLRQTNATMDAMANEVNTGLAQFAQFNNRVQHVFFPFPFVEGGEYWSSDNLHFSAAGHEALGRALEPPVRRLWKLTKLSA